MRKVRLVSELDESRDLRRARAYTFALFAKLYVLQNRVFVRVDLGINRINRDYRGKHALRARPRLNEVTERNARVAHAAVDGRFDLGELQIQRGGVFRCFGRGRCGGGALISRSLLVELAGRNRIFGPQLLRAVQFALRKLELRP